MPMRLQEVHPALVHFPITLLPLAVGADLLGRATNNQRLMDAGRVGIAMAAGSAAVAGVFGLIAQQEVNVEGHTLDMLVTHRNLNLAAITTATAMAAKRWSERRPSTPYLALGLAAIGVVSYSAYLGGHMVYEHGVAVKAADGLRPEGVPHLAPGELGTAARTAGRDLAAGARVAAREIREGKLAPTLTRQGGDGEHPEARA